MSNWINPKNKKTFTIPLLEINIIWKVSESWNGSPEVGPPDTSNGVFTPLIDGTVSKIDEKLLIFLIFWKSGANFTEILFGLQWHHCICMCVCVCVCVPIEKIYTEKNVIRLIGILIENSNFLLN